MLYAMVSCWCAAVLWCAGVGLLWRGEYSARMFQGRGAGKRCATCKGFLCPLYGSWETSIPPCLRGTVFCPPRLWGVEVFTGGDSGRETPGYIPNPEAKPSSADGTALV